jgi:hypothetical protein
MTNFGEKTMYVFMVSITNKHYLGTHKWIKIEEERVK